MEFPQGPICQSCGMPLRKDEDFGTNQDGSKKANKVTIVTLLAFLV